MGHALAIIGIALTVSFVISVAVGKVIGHGNLLENDESARPPT